MPLLPDLDPECRSLVEAMNFIPGIHTLESCCGHGKEPFRIWFTAETVECLSPIAAITNGYTTDCFGWYITIGMHNETGPVIFCLRGPVNAYSEANELARLLQQETMEIVT